MTPSALSEEITHQRRKKVSMVPSALYTLEVSQRIDMYQNHISLNKSQVELIELDMLYWPGKMYEYVTYFQTVLLL